MIPMSGREKEIVKVRTSASGLRPCIEIDLAGPGRRLDLTEIVVRPGQDAQRSLNAASMFLDVSSNTNVSTAVLLWRPRREACCPTCRAQQACCERQIVGSGFQAVLHCCGATKTQSQVPKQGTKVPVLAWIVALEPVSPVAEPVTVMVPGPIAWTRA